MTPAPDLSQAGAFAYPPEGNPTMKRAVAVLFTAAALTVAVAPTASADPAPGGNNPAKVCVPPKSPADPPSCPGN